MRTRKRLLAILLVLTMVLTMLPTAVLAEDETGGSGPAPQADAGITTADALAEAVAQGGEVTLGGDITLNSMLVIGCGQTVAIDLGGYTLTGADDTCVIRALGGAQVTVKNGTIQMGNLINDEYWVWGVDNRGGTVAIDGVAITGEEGDAVSAYWDNISNKTPEKNSGGTTMLTNCSIDVPYGYAAEAYNAPSSRVVFGEGCFVCSGWLEAWESEDGSEKAVIEATLGAKFSDSLLSDVEKYVTLPEGAILFRDNGESGYTVVLESSLEPAATIGETAYYTLRDAIGQARNGDTVVVQRDMDTKTAAYAVSGKSITLDLNGKKLTMTRPSNNTVPISVKSGAGLTVKDSAGQGELHLVYPQTADYSGHMIETRGSFTLEGGAIIAEGKKPRYDYYYVIEAGAGTLTISGGSVTIPGDWAADRKTVHAGTSTTVSITGGTFTNLDAGYVAEGYVAVPQLDGSVQVMARTENAVAIVGSEQYTSLTDAFTAANGGTVTLLADISEASAVAAGASAVLNLAGRTVTGKLTAAGELTIMDSKTEGSVKDIESSGTVAITGGRIDGTLTVSGNGSFLITGGLFANAFDEKWCAVGYSAVKGSDNYYTPGIDSGKWAEDNTKKAEDGAYLIENETDMIRFAAYVNAGNAIEGKTVRLTADLDFSGCDYLPAGTSTAPFNGTFDGGDHTISNAAVSQDKSYAGIFGVTGAQAEIKNLRVKDSDFALPVGQYTYAGGIVADALGSVTNCTAENVKTDGWFSGAIAGHTYGMTITQVTVTGCDAGSAKAGGVVGYAEDLKVSEATVTNTMASGAMVGHANGDTVLENVVVSSDAEEKTPLIGTAYETKKTITITGDGTAVDVSKIVGDSTGPADVVLSGGTYQVSEPTAVSSGSTLTIGDVTIASTSGEAIATLEESARVVKNDGTITTVAGGGASEATGSVDQYGNLILPAGSTVQKGEEEPTVIGNDSVITPNGNIVQGTADEPPTVDAATGVVTVPAGGTVMTPAGEVAQMPNGGTVTPPANEGGDAGDIVKPTIIVTLDKTALSLTVGGEETLAVTVNPKDSAEAVAWSSDKPAVAEVAGGVVTAVAPGIADITVSVTTAYGVETAVCKVTVNPALTPIDPDSKAAAYKVEHYKEALDGGYTLADVDFPLYYQLDEVVNAEAKIYVGYTLDEENENAVPSGTVALPAAGEDGQPVILTLKLYYKLNEYTVSFNSDGGSAVGSQTVKYGGGAVRPENPTKLGYTFTGWELDGTAFDFGTAITDDITLTAQWSRKSSGGSSGGSASSGYAVSVGSMKNGSVSISPKNAKKDDTVTITVIPDKGYKVDAVTVTDKDGKTIKVTEGKNGKYTFTMPASKVKVAATFTKVEETPAHTFTDVPDGHWAGDEIAWAYEQGYMNGNTDVTFNPGGTVTRQQLWMILARLSGQRPAGFAEAKAWAVQNGVSDGTAPGKAVSRQQLVTILYRCAQLCGYDVSGAADLTAFPDHASVAAYAADAMSWSVANGIVGGTARGTLNPNGTATRAQFAAILYRFCEKTVK